MQLNVPYLVSREKGWIHYYKVYSEFRIEIKTLLARLIKEWADCHKLLANVLTCVFVDICTYHVFVDSIWFTSVTIGNAVTTMNNLAELLLQLPDAVDNADTELQEVSQF